jgi:hypothetical protein
MHGSTDRGCTDRGGAGREHEVAVAAGKHQPGERKFEKEEAERGGGLAGRERRAGKDMVGGVGRGKAGHGRVKGVQRVQSAAYSTARKQAKEHKI